VGEDRLSRELGPREVPEDANESLPLAATGPRRASYSESLSRGSEDRSGVQQEVPAPPREGARVLEDPPRGRRPSGEQ
jgi:hypothetical protein